MFGRVESDGGDFIFLRTRSPPIESCHVLVCLRLTSYPELVDLSGVFIRPYVLIIVLGHDH